MTSDQPGLAARLREATADLHRAAERSGIIHKLLTGRANRFDFSLLLRNLLSVYEALEAGLEQHRNAVLFTNLIYPELYRCPALRHDLAQIGGAPKLLPAGIAYAARVAQAASDDGAELLGVAYVRYLGDLSGGQILSRLITRSLELPPPAFYQFPAIADQTAFRDAYRRAIDEAGLLLGDTTRVIAAAQDAFRLDIALSEAVARTAKAVKR